MNKKTQKLISAAVIGALYAVLTLALSPVSYGPLQFRLSEVLCILPYFLPFTAWGLFFGCVIANLVSAAGILDIVFGSLATLISCLIMARLGKDGATLKTEIAACLIPVIINGIIVGAVLCYALTDLMPWNNPVPFFIYAGDVALGELAVMLAVGLPLMRYLPRQRFFAEQLTKLS